MYKHLYICDAACGEFMACCQLTLSLKLFAFGLDIRDMGFCSTVSFGILISYCMYIIDIQGLSLTTKCRMISMGWGGGGGGRGGSNYMENICNDISFYFMDMSKMP